MAKVITYQQAGVDIDAGERLVGLISEKVQSTHGPRVLYLPNSFAGLFQLDYQELLDGTKNPQVDAKPAQICLKLYCHSLTLN